MVVFFRNFPTILSVMKKILFPLLTMIAASAIAHAGPIASPKQIIPPATPCLWDWFAGGSAGYVSGDWDEDIYTVHFGAEYDCGGDTHAFFLEVGYTEKDSDIDHYKPESEYEGGGYHDFLVYAETEIIPITINYKFESSISDKWSWYAGVGAGVALVDLDVVNSGNASETGSWSDTVFYAHIFAGIIYKVNSSFELFGGVRYIYMDDPRLSGFSDIDSHATLDGDLHFEIGGRYKF